MDKVASVPSPRTRWAVPPPWAGDAAQSAARPDSRWSSSAAVLCTLLRQDLARGHTRVALRHFMMTQACGLSLPPELRECCELLLERCPPGARQVIAEQVRRWADSGFA